MRMRLQKLLMIALTCFVGFLAPAAAQTKWTKSTEIWFNADNPKSPVAVFFNTESAAGVTQLLRGRWITIDLTRCCNVPPDAKQAFLAGLLIVSHGSEEEVCDLQVAFRSPGSTWGPANYLGQTIEASVGNGQRTPMATWVPLVNGKFEFHWQVKQLGRYPEYCAYGVNLSLQAWTR